MHSIRSQNYSCDCFFFLIRGWKDFNLAKTPHCLTLPHLTKTPKYLWSSSTVNDIYTYHNLKKKSKCLEWNTILFQGKILYDRLAVTRWQFQNKYVRLHCIYRVVPDLLPRVFQAIQIDLPFYEKLILFLLSAPDSHHKARHWGVQQVWQHAKVQAAPSRILKKSPWEITMRETHIRSWKNTKTDQPMESNFKVDTDSQQLVSENEGFGKGNAHKQRFFS